MVEWLILAMAVLLAGERMAELALAHRNRQWLTALGAVEYGRQHYYLFFLLHGCWFAGWLSESLTRAGLHELWPLWLALFAGSQVLRYWSIRSLGRNWNTRIFVVPGATMIRRGPYRYLPHPNYLAVAGELFTVPMLFGAWMTAVLATAANGALLLGVRIPQEEEALRQMKGHH